MSSFRGNKNQESPYLKALRKIFIARANESADKTALFIYNVGGIQLNSGIFRRSVYLPAGSPVPVELKEKEKEFHIYKQYMAEMGKYYSQLDGERTENKTISVDYKPLIKQLGYLGDIGYFASSLSLDLVSKQPGFYELQVDKVLMDRDDKLGAQAFDINTFIDITTDLLLASAEAMSFTYDDSNNKKQAVRAGTGSEIIVKNKRDKITYTETDLLDFFTEQMQVITQQIKPRLLELAESNGEWAHADRAVREEYVKNNPGVTLNDTFNLYLPAVYSGHCTDLHTKTWGLYADLCALINSQMKAIKKLFRGYSGHYYRKTFDKFIMTRDMEFSAAKLVAVENMPILQKNYLQTTAFAPSPGDLITANITASGLPFFATKDQLSSMARAESIIGLFNQISEFLDSSLNSIGKAYGATSANRGVDFIAGSRSGQANVIHMVTAAAGLAGLSSSTIQNIITNNILKYKPLVGSVRPSSKSESNALRKFLSKIGMSIDISGTNVPTAEKAVATRLRQLGRELSEKYGVDYDSEPGNVVLAAMRRADDLDEIMVGISAALEDCISIIDSAPSE